MFDGTDRTKIGKHFLLSSWLLWGYVFICILGIPFLYLLGFDISLSYTPGMIENSLDSFLYLFYFYTILNWSTFIFALISSIGLFIYYIAGVTKNDVIISFIGLVLISTAVGEFIHFFEDRAFFLNQIDSQKLYVFNWLISRLFNASILLFPGFYLLSQSKERLVKSKMVLWNVIGVFVIISLISFVLRNFYPLFEGWQFVYSNAFIKRPYELLSCLFYALSLFVVFPLLYEKHPSIFTKALVISVIPLFLGEVMIVFFPSAHSDFAYHYALWLKFASISTFSLAIMVDYARSIYYLREQKKSLTAVNKELDEFAYIVSHDLKAPVRAVNSYITVIFNEAHNLEPEVKSYLTKVQNVTKKMGDLIESVLNYSRAGSSQIKKNMYSMRKIVDDVILILEPYLEEENIEIEVEKDLGKVFADKNLVQQVLMNLVTNAIKYNDKKNKKLIIGKIQSDTFNTSENIYFVRDNGIGIEEQYKDQIFKIFKRINIEKLGHAVEGTGAGLTITKKIIHRLGGDIWFKSVPGEGTTFYFCFHRKNTFS